MVVRRKIRILFELFIGDWDALLIAEQLQIIQGQLLHLVSCVTTLKVMAKAVTLNGVCQDHGWAILGFQCTLVGCENLAVIVSTAWELPDFLIGHVFHELCSAWIASEEVLTNICAVVSLEGLVITVRGVVHDLDKCAVLVLLKQFIPLAAPDNLDHRPTCATEEGLEFLDNLGVTAHRAIKALQVAVNHEGEVIQVIQCCLVDQAT